MSEVTSLSVTEALAKIRTIDKRLAAKWDFVGSHCLMDSRVKDPLGDTSAEVGSAMQAIRDLETQKVKIREAISTSNKITTLSVGSWPSRTVSEWLVWRREIAGDRLARLRAVRSTVNEGMKQLQRALADNIDKTMPAPGLDQMVDLAEIEQEIEDLDALLSELDGRLSMINATTIIKV